MFICKAWGPIMQGVFIHWTGVDWTGLDWTHPKISKMPFSV